MSRETFYVPHILLTEAEKTFFSAKSQYILSTKDTVFGTSYELSEKAYNAFEKHIVLANTNRAFALRAVSRVMRIAPERSKDPELCKAVILNCAISMYPFAPLEADRLLRSAKV